MIVEALEHGWSCAATRPGAVGGPLELDGAGLEWWPVSGSAGAGVRAEPLAAIAAGRGDLDALDWWFRLRIDRPPPGDWILDIGGIATLADVWLDGRHILRSENMFHAHRAAVRLEPDGGSPECELVVRCASVKEALSTRRPRPGWKAPIASDQGLRWIRTSLLGRLRGPSAPLPIVGIWRGAVLRRREDIEVTGRRITTSYDDGSGTVEVEVHLDVSGAAPDAATLVVGSASAALVIEATDDEVILSGRLRVDHARPWWPATHGDQPRYEVVAEVSTPSGGRELHLGTVGFRSISWGTPDDPEVSVNGQPIFCRGACWSPVDLGAAVQRVVPVREALIHLRDAGMNLVRVPGTTAYESDEFYDACDELGILVWQDLMFANMDYPGDDPGFAESVTVELEQLLDRLQGRPSIVAICGGSEHHQQPTMLGRPLATIGQGPLEKLMASLVQSQLPGTAFWASSPSGGDLAISVDRGIAHYFGVGGYRRSLDDARTSNVRFATECLAFSTIPADDSIHELQLDGWVVGDLRWHGGVPRDGGRSWDHEEVRDHYVRDVLGVDPLQVRAVDPARYLDLGRCAVAEVVARAMAEWRRPGSRCRGAVVLEHRDLVDGAGWGLIDARGRPKSSWFALARVLQDVAILLSDEGLNGLDVHIVNDRPEGIDGDLTIEAFRGSSSVARAEVGCRVAARSATTIRAEAALGSFLDVTYAYRFGPPQVDAVTAHLTVDGDLIARAVHLPANGPLEQVDLGLAATARRVGEDLLELDITTQRPARCILIHAPGGVLSDDAFDLEPGGHAAVSVRGARPGALDLRAVNGLDLCTIGAIDG